MSINLIPRTCETCLLISTCDSMTEAKLQMDCKCPSWKLACENDRIARQEVVRDFGHWALVYENQHLQNKSVKIRHNRRRKKNG